LGQKGDMVDVSEGYARNYLLARGLAVEASDGTVRHFENEKKRIQAKADHEFASAQEAAGKLEGLSVTMKAKAGEAGRLFGSITSKDIAEALGKTAHLRIDRRRIILDEAIKTLGVHEVQVKLHPKVGVTVKVIVEPDREGME